MSGRCFLCDQDTDLGCPHCGAWICGEKCLIYHRHAGSEPVNLVSGDDLNLENLKPDKKCQPYKLKHGEKVNKV